MSDKNPPSSPSQSMPGVASAAGVFPYEKRLDQDLGWALTEGSIYFEGRGKVQETWRRIARWLDDLGVSYAIAEGMALFLHGYRRFTEVVDLLVTSEGLKTIHPALEGLGDVAPFARSKHLRDAESGVKTEFIVTVGYPGDGEPKPVVFPDPTDVSTTQAGIRALKLPTRMALQLASGMSAPGRGRELSDVQEFIKHQGLPQSMADQLDRSIRDKFIKLWHYAQAPDPEWSRLLVHG